MTTTPQHTDPSTLARALREELLGQVIDPGHPGYDAARRVWNGLIDRRPAVIARCHSKADVVAAVQVARRFRPPVSIRGGGHQVAGAAVGDDALVIDLSGMTAVQVDPGRAPSTSRRARPGPTSTAPRSATAWRSRVVRSPTPASPASRSAAAWGCCSVPTASPATTFGRSRSSPPTARSAGRAARSTLTCSGRPAAAGGAWGS